MTSSIHLAAFVAPSEKPVVEAACAHLLRALRSGGGEWTADCQFVETLDDLATAPAGTLIVTSLLPEVDYESWEAARSSLCDTYARLSENHGAVFISTILRHVEDDDRKAAHARRIRIRRLNSLAADLSREFGAFVIDLDRVLADIGAGRLGTDYRLKGDAAIDLAGKAMATEIAANGLDALAEVDVQDAAIAYLARYQINDALLQEIKPLEIRPHNVMALGRGRRKQFVETVIDNDQNGHVGWLVQQALKGKISPAAAFDKLNQAVRRRGTGESIAMLARALVRIGRRA